MSESGNEYAKEFLQSAINNASEMIFFSDTKAAALFVLYSIIFAGVLEIRSSIKETIYSIISNGVGYKVIVYVGIFLICLFAIISIAYAMKSLKPNLNSADEVKDNTFDDSNIWYVNNECESNFLKVGKISIKLDSYFEKISTKDDEFFLKCLSFELLKLSYIRNIKMDYVSKSIEYFNYFIFSLTILVIIVAVTTF